MAYRKALYRCWSCGWYAGKRILKKYQDECPNCCTVIDIEFEPTQDDIKELGKRLRDERKHRS